MAPEYVFDVERHGFKARGDAIDFGRRNEQENGARVDETADQPGTGNAVDLRPRPRDPDRASLRIALWKLVGADRRKLRLSPGGVAAFQVASGKKLT